MKVVNYTKAERASADGPALGPSIAEEQMIGDVSVVVTALLGQEVVPTG